MNGNYNSYNSGNMNQNPYNNVNNNFDNQEANKKRKIIFFIIFFIVVIGICIFCYFKFVKSVPSDQEQQNHENVSEAFLMPIEDVFSVTNRGVIMTGRIERGGIHIGDSIQLMGIDDEIINTSVKSIDLNNKEVESAKSGDYVGIILKNIEKSQIKRGKVLAQPNSIGIVKKFEAEVSVFSKEDNKKGNALTPDSKFDFYIRTSDFVGNVTLLNGKQTIRPGENATIIVELDSSVALEKGTKFYIRQNKVKFGQGIVTKVY